MVVFVLSASDNNSLKRVFTRPHVVLVVWHRPFQKSARLYSLNAMKPSAPPTIDQACPQPLAGWLFALALALLPVASLRADAPATALHITNTGKNTEALPTYRLDWVASSNSTYLVQSATSLAPGATWSTLDAVTPVNQVGSYQLSVTASDSTGLSSPPATFYRLILPQPQIFSVEPAVVAPGVAVDLYVLGQCFETNDVLLINGAPQTNFFYASSLLVKPVFTPGASGTYTVQLSRGGAVVSSFTVVCADPLANPELVLQGPPELPPAAPNLARWADELEKLAKASSKKKNAMFAVPPPIEPPANSSVRSSGHAGEKLEISWETMELKAGKAAPPGGGGGGGIRENDNVVFDVQEGKKGLNAVNVKRTLWGLGGNVDIATRTAVTLFSGTPLSLVPVI